MDLTMNHDQIPSAARTGLGHFTMSLIARYQTWRNVRRDKCALSHLFTQTLRDIGLEEYASRCRNSFVWPKASRDT